MLFGQHQQSPKPNHGKNSMYSTIVDNSPLIQVAAGKHSAIYALDGSQMNPLEAFYAVLAACAAVYAKKACKELAVPAEGIEINCKPFAGKAGPLSLAKFRTEVRFPERFTAEQKVRILEAIAHCAVKEVVQDGPSIEFTVVEI
ncbi:MAG: OsmC family protein [Betaproteobacteria bacterium]|nr:OsmC family protein [Betaproteobacteria bacterium]